MRKNPEDKTEKTPKAADNDLISVHTALARNYANLLEQNAQVQSFQIVDKVPLGYQIWNIGRNMLDGYLPFCRLASRQPFDGAREVEIETLKAIPAPYAQEILAAAGSAGNTQKELEEHLCRHRNAKPGSWEYLEIERIQRALPYLRALPR